MKPSKLLLMLAAPLMLIACATPQASEPPTSSPAPSPAPADGKAVACASFGPIIFDRLTDTEDTIAAVKAHNAVWVALCRPPP